MKNPTLILCDEVTSSVDAFAERDIVDTLRRASEQRTTLTGDSGEKRGENEREMRGEERRSGR